MDLEILQGRYESKIVPVESYNNWIVKRSTKENNEIDFIAAHDWVSE